MNQSCAYIADPSWVGRIATKADKNTSTAPTRPEWPGYVTAPGGFSLLEIILALAIFAGSLAALGEVMRQADRNASLSSDETRAQIIAASIMDELIAGSLPATATNRTVYDPTIDPPWLYSIAIENTSYAGLVGVRVLVEQELEAQLQPAKFELVRWLLNSSTTAQTDSESDTSSSSTSSSSSTGSSSSGSSSTGGSGGGP